MYIYTHTHVLFGCAHPSRVTDYITHNLYICMYIYTHTHCMGLLIHRKWVLRSVTVFACVCRERERARESERE